MDAVDKKILDMLQQGMEICQRPYQAMAEEAGISEEDTIKRIEAMKENGIIRRVSAFFDPRRIGYKSTLCAINVPENRVEEAAAVINGFDEVTHNYLRENDTYNIWFTIIAIGDEGIEKVVSQISQRLGLEVSNFSSEAFYKIKVNFNMGDMS